MHDDDIKTIGSKYESLEEFEERINPMITDLTKEGSQKIYDEMSDYIKPLFEIIDSCESVDEVVELYGLLFPYLDLIQRVARKTKMVEHKLRMKAGALALEQTD